jgi:hypothetical protein
MCNEASMAGQESKGGIFVEENHIILHHAYTNTGNPIND